jgi:hypothetical protein
MIRWIVALTIFLFLAPAVGFAASAPLLEIFYDDEVPTWRMNSGPIDTILPMNKKVADALESLDHSGHLFAYTCKGTAFHMFNDRDGTGYTGISALKAKTCVRSN